MRDSGENEISFEATESEHGSETMAAMLVASLSGCVIGFLLGGSFMYAVLLVMACAACSTLGWIVRGWSEVPAAALRNPNAARPETR